MRAHGARPCRRRCGPARMGFSSSRASTHVTPGRHAGRQPHRRMGGDRPHRRRDGRARCRHLPGRPGHRAAARAHRAFLDRLRQVALDSRRPIMFGVLATKQGDDPEPVGLPDQVHRRHRRRRRPHVRPGHDALDQRDLLAEVLPAVRRPAGLAADPRAAARRAEEAAARSRRCGARWSRPRPRMKPRDNDVPGRRRGDHRSAQARLRQPVRDEGRRLGRSDGRPARRGARPASGRGDDRPVAGRRRTRSIVQPLVNESPDDVLGMLKHPRTLATFSDSGAHVCQEMGSSLQTHLLELLGAQAAAPSRSSRRSGS